MMIKSAWRRFRDIFTFLWKARRIEHKIFSQDILLLKFSWYVFRKRNVVFDGMSSEIRGFPGGSVVESQPAIAGDEKDLGSIPESGRSPGGGNGNPFQCSCLENSVDRGAWWATVHGVAKSQTWHYTCPNEILNQAFAFMNHSCPQHLAQCLTL